MRYCQHSHNQGFIITIKQVSRNDYKVTKQIIEKTEKLVQDENGGLKKVSVAT